ncbi:MAG: hypothetical protein M3173_06175, partial [Chloroflexota bacterium]|nr:hypothetical protein [Chloroflexota bacterium]
KEMTTTDTRHTLHQLIESLPDGELYTDKCMLKHLPIGDSLRWAIIRAPEGEPLSPEEEQALSEAEANVSAGRWSRTTSYESTRTPFGMSVMRSPAQG